MIHNIFYCAGAAAASPPSFALSFLFIFLLFILPGGPPPNELPSLKLIYLSDFSLTKNDGDVTT